LFLKFLLVKSLILGGGYRSIDNNHPTKLYRNFNHLSRSGNKYFYTKLNDSLPRGEDLEY